MRTQDYKINHRIKVSEVRLLSRHGENLGVVTTSEALRLAQQEDMDLVLVAENAKPPVAKVLDFNKYLYEERKKISGMRNRSKKNELKEIVFGPTIDTGDLTSKMTRARNWLKEGNRVKVTVKFRGREQAYPKLGFDKLKKFQEELSDVAKLEAEPKHFGNLISATFLKK